MFPTRVRGAYYRGANSSFKNDDKVFISSRVFCHLRSSFPSFIRFSNSASSSLSFHMLFRCSGPWVRVEFTVPFQYSPFVTVGGSAVLSQLTSCENRFPRIAHVHGEPWRSPQKGKMRRNTKEGSHQRSHGTVLRCHFIVTRVRS